MIESLGFFQTPKEIIVLKCWELSFDSATLKDIFKTFKTTRLEAYLRRRRECLLRCNCRGGLGDVPHRPRPGAERTFSGWPQHRHQSLHTLDETQTTRHLTTQLAHSSVSTLHLRDNACQCKAWNGGFGNKRLDPKLELNGILLE